MNTHRDPDWFDSRILFRIYAWAMGLGGFLVAGWGVMAIAGYRGDHWFIAAPFIRVVGGLMLTIGCVAAPLARLENPTDRQYALRWLGMGQLLLAVIVWTQVTAIWYNAWGAVASGLLFASAFLIFYLRSMADGRRPGQSAMPTTLFDRPASASMTQLRSQYEQQIREAASQEERHRLARDLHDSVKQQIFVIQTAAATAQARFDGDQAGAREALDHVRSAAREAMSEMEAMLDQLRAEPLENSGLIEALARQCEALRIRTGATVEFRPGLLPASERIPPGGQQALLRVAQEALSNIARHAAASHVTLAISSDQQEVRLIVEDNGRGFDSAAAAAGMGLANMRERAEAYGGTFGTFPRAEGGTRVTFAIPVMPGSERALSERRTLLAVWSGLLLFAGGLAVVANRDQDPMFFNHIAVAVVAAVLVVREAVAYRRHAKLERRPS